MYFNLKIINKFFEQLNNNNNHEKFNIQDKKHISFIKSLSKIYQDLLYECEIIDKETYAALISKSELSANGIVPEQNLPESSSVNTEQVIEIIKGDKIEAFQRLIREQGINAISPIIRLFNEVEKVKIPIII